MVNCTSTRSGKRKGFTLIEILLVVIMVGILASMALLSGGGATAQGKAASIVNDLRQLKSAALLFYAASIDTKTAVFGEAISQPDSIVTCLGKYLGNPDQFEADSDVTWAFWSSSGKDWFVGRLVEDLDDDIMSALSAVAKSSGLIAFDAASGKSTTIFVFDESGTNKPKYVALKVR